MPSRKTADHSEGKWAAAFAPRRRGERRYWLVKSEPDVFSFDDLLAAPSGRPAGTGVRNFAARNFLRDGMRRGDGVLFYHSMADPQAVVGVCEVVREGYPDHTALDPAHRTTTRIPTGRPAVVHGGPARGGAARAAGARSPRSRRGRSSRRWRSCGSGGCPSRR
jgi:hypothetical protein